MPTRQGNIEQLTGVEDALRADFTQAGRPISGVETGTQQLGFLSGLPLHSQREMLEAMVDAFAAGDPDITGPNEDGWLSGDIDDIATEMAELPPEVYDVLITRRNARLDRLAARPDGRGRARCCSRSAPAISPGAIRSSRCSLRGVCGSRGWTDRQGTVSLSCLIVS